MNRGQVRLRARFDRAKQSDEWILIFESSSTGSLDLTERELLAEGLEVRRRHAVPSFKHTEGSDTILEARRPPEVA